VRARPVALSAVLTAVCLCAAGYPLALEDDFTERGEGWQTLAGDWAWGNGRLSQRAVPDSYYMALWGETLVEGVITVEGIPTAPNSSRDGCLGIVCKYIDKNNWVAVRFGAYKRVWVMTTVEGRREFSALRPFVAEIGRRYHCQVKMSQGLILIELDGKPAGVCRDPFPKRPGRPGVYAQSPAEFLAFSVGESPDVPDLVGPARAAFAAGPRIAHKSAAWALEAIEYAVAPLSPTIGGPDHHTLALYLRNRSSSPLTVADVSLDGEPSATLIQQGRIAWWRAWPERVPPGAVAQVTIKMASIPLPRAAQAMLGCPVGPYLVRMDSPDVDPLEVEFALAPTQPPLRINFIAFDDALRVLHAYVAADADLVGRQIERIEVNGVDVTDRVQPDLIAAGRLRSDTLPLRIDLESPLEPAAPAVVTVRAGDAFAGHAVRAFPSRFPVQLTILGRQPGPAEVDEIANLCFTDVGFCGARWENMADLSRNNLLYFPYSYPSAKSMDTYLVQEKRPRLSAWWIDEIDGWKKTPHDAQRMLREADAAMRERGLPIAPYCMNIMAPWADVGYIELADALSHEYGIDFGIADSDGCRRTLDFRTPGDISRRELRISRLPWWPYFRNIEGVLLLEPETKQVVKHYRPMDPREHRLIVYSCLANGAKGALNWNYGSNYVTSKQSTWLSDKYDALRLNMTAQRDREAFGVAIPEEMLDSLRDATHECARVNAELQLLGPLLAMGDVSDLATVTRSTPETNPRGGPAVHARAIVCGLDTLVLIVTNLNIESNFNAREPEPVKSYAPVSAEVKLALPPWLEPADVFGVSYRGMTPVDSEHEDGALSFSFPAVDVGLAVVITSDVSLQARMETALQPLRDKLRAAGGDLR